MRKLTAVFFVAIIAVTTIANMPDMNNLDVYKDIYEPSLELPTPDNDIGIQNAKNTILGLKLKKDTVQLIDKLHKITRLYIDKLDYVSAYDAVLEALNLSEAINDSAKISESFKNLSEISWTYGQGAYAIRYINDAIRINKKLSSKNKLHTKELIGNYYYASIIYRQLKDYDMGLIYADSCIALSDALQQDTIHRSYHHSEKAILYMLQGHYRKGEEIMLRAKEVFEAVPTSDSINKVHVDYLVFVYCYLGYTYAHQNKLQLSREYYYKSLWHINQNKGHLGMRPYILFELSKVLDKQGDLKEAYKALLVSKLQFDHYYGINSGRNLKLIALKSAYEEELKKKNDLLYQNSMLLAEKENNQYKIRFLFITLLVIIILGILVIRNWRQRIKLLHDKEIIERENDLLDRATKNIIEVKNKELTTYTLQLIEKDKTNKALVKMLNGNKNLEDIKPHLKSIQSEKGLWNEFNHRFNSVNTGFYERLSSKFSDLSSTDLKHCALIKLNFTGKEMSHLLGISLTSVHTSRHRIRKKMNLGRDESLSHFISTI